MCGANDRPRQFRRADQRGAASRSRNFFCWTAHIDIQTIEAKLADYVRDLVEELRCLPVDLSNHRSLDLGISEIFEKNVRGKECGLNIHEFRQRHIGTAVL